MIFVLVMMMIEPHCYININPILLLYYADLTNNVQLQDKFKAMDTSINTLALKMSLLENSKYGVVYLSNPLVFWFTFDTRVNCLRKGKADSDKCELGICKI